MLVEEDAAAELINGYTEVHPLPAPELELLNLLERARCVGAIVATLSIQAAGGYIASDHSLVVDNLLTIAEERWPSLRRRLGLP
jgi:Ser/Thr protein kinase RdoA (MazF antagonist)